MHSVLFVINDLDAFAAHQSTAELIEVCARYVDVWVTTVDGFAVTPAGITVACWRAETDRVAMIARMRSSTWTELPIDALDAVWVRTNPGRDVRSPTAWMQLLLQVEDAGMLVRNTPTGLLRAASKLHLGTLPSGTVPRTWASADPERLSAFLDVLDGPAVVKPSLGTQGSGVVRLSPDTPDRAEILERAVATGPAVLQDYLPEAPLGDVRIHVVDGTILEVDGHPCAVRRVPASGEWRSNVALGGTPKPPKLTDAQRALVGRVGPVLVAQGLWHVGLDVVGDKVVECNVFSPGGLSDAGLFAGVDFATALVHRFLR